MPASRADRTLSCAANWKARRRALLVRRSIRATARSRSADDSDSRPAVRIPFRRQQRRQRRHDRLQHLPRPDTRMLVIHEIVHQQIKNRPIRRLIRSRLPLTPSLPSTNASQSDATLSQKLFERKTKGPDFPALYWRVGALLRGGPSGKLVETCPQRWRGWSRATGHFGGVRVHQTRRGGASFSCLDRMRLPFRRRKLRTCRSRRSGGRCGRHEL